jgi:hypothetical protein
MERNARGLLQLPVQQQEVDDAWRMISMMVPSLWQVRGGFNNLSFF